MELDGELYCHGMSHEEIHGVVSRTVNLHPDYSKIEYWIFDIVSPGAQFCRLSRIASLNLSHTPNLKYVVPELAWSIDDVMLHYYSFLDQGYEGIIVRHPGAFYTRKRSIHMLKFKPKQSDSYKIVGYSEEVSITGILKGRVGSLICEDDMGTRFGVGSGLTVEWRETLWKNRDLLTTGELTAHVKYQSKTENKVPRFPILIEVVHPSLCKGGLPPL